MTAIRSEITAASNEQSTGIEEAADASGAMHDESRRLADAVSESKLGNGVRWGVKS